MSSFPYSDVVSFLEWQLLTQCVILLPVAPLSSLQYPKLDPSGSQVHILVLIPVGRVHMIPGVSWCFADTGPPDVWLVST